MKQPSIAALGVIGDRSTCALVDTDASICWYCPQLFDAAAVCSSLIDDTTGGHWSLAAKDKIFVNRSYLQRSGILVTSFRGASGEFSVTDWMDIGGSHRGIRRLISASPEPLRSVLMLRGNYGAEVAIFRSTGRCSAFCDTLQLSLHTSHALMIDVGSVVFDFPAHESGWAVLLDSSVPVVDVTHDSVQTSLRVTAEHWGTLAAHFEYRGAFAREVFDSIRAVQLMTDAASGAVVAAATTSLPEQLGGKRNYDYRYAWIRDLCLITSAMVSIETRGDSSRRVLEFIGSAVRTEGKLLAVYRTSGQFVPDVRSLPVSGYRNSTPVVIGNAAAEQLQLDSQGALLMAARLIYDHHDECIEWPMIAAVADTLARSWQLPDNGIWEEQSRHRYTSSMVYAAMGLEAVAAYAQTPQQARNWRNAAVEIRKYIQTQCLTRTGAFAVYPGSQDVDLAAALYPIWRFCEPSSPEMQTTVLELERYWCTGDLYRRRLDEDDSHREGVFLAGSCWMAHFYAISGNLPRARRILDAICLCHNDLGLFAEEADSAHGMLGNFPQTFVHSSFVCAAHGYETELAGRDGRVAFNTARASN